MSIKEQNDEVQRALYIVRGLADVNKTMLEAITSTPSATKEHRQQLVTMHHTLKGINELHKQFNIPKLQIEVMPHDK